jgi:hypothetical protein
MLTQIELAERAGRGEFISQFTALDGVTQPRGRFDQRVDHGLQVESRAADDLEYIRGSGLLLQRLPDRPATPRSTVRPSDSSGRVRQPKSASANQSLSAIEPVCGTPKRKLENGHRDRTGWLG